MKKQERILAWHFTKGMTLRDGQPLVVGKTYRHKGPVVMCNQGYHASERLIDALMYAPGAQVSRVEVWGDIGREDDKIVGRNRKVLWTLDATMILHEFACRVAEQALAKINNPDPRSLEAIRVKRLWMQGKATDEEIYAARSAAWSAADSTAWSAAWSAADSAARSAAWSAAWSAADSAAWSAARSAHNTLLAEMIEQAHKEATDDRS